MISRGNCRLTTLSILCTLLVLGSLPRFAQAKEPAAEGPAALLLRATVTIRVCARKPLDELVSKKELPENRQQESGKSKKPSASEEALSAKKRSRTAPSKKKTNRSTSTARAAATTSLRENPSKKSKPSCASGCVSVCSGVSLGDGRIITFGHLPSLREQLATDFRYRVTLPDGKQACAEAEVIDFYSGLVLLRVRNMDLPRLELADEIPKVGSEVLTAAASGIEASLVSKGVLSGLDRTLSGSNLPPMVQCDVSTTETSSGAPLINKQGQLIGVLAATAKPTDQKGWCYAIPSTHIKRVLDARVENRLIVLVRQRPWMGLRLGPGKEQGTVFVERVSRDSPALAAGVQVGDQLLAADGVQVRSAYQAVFRVMKHQPGDKMKLRLARDNKKIDLEIELAGGGHVFASLPPRNQQQVVEATRDTTGRIELRNHRGAAELAYDRFAVPADKKTKSANSERLKRRLNTSLYVILKLQHQLEKSRQNEKKTQQRLDSLEKELQRLREQMQEHSK